MIRINNDIVYNSQNDTIVNTYSNKILNPFIIGFKSYVTYTIQSESKIIDVSKYKPVKQLDISTGNIKVYDGTLKRTTYKKHEEITRLPEYGYPFIRGKATYNPILHKLTVY